MLALLIIDMQQGVCLQPTFFNAPKLVHAINQRIQRYRQKKLPIIFIQHQDSELLPNRAAWQLMPQLDARDTDAFIAKTHANSFYQTDLAAYLAQHKITELEIWGAQTQYCVDSTIKFAHGLGFQLYSFPNASSTTDHPDLTATQLIAFYESIWQHRFLTFEDPLQKECTNEHLPHEKYT